MKGKQEIWGKLMFKVPKDIGVTLAISHTLAGLLWYVLFLILLKMLCSMIWYACYLWETEPFLFWPSPISWWGRKYLVPLQFQKHGRRYIRTILCSDILAKTSYEETVKTHEYKWIHWHLRIRPLTVPTYAILHPKFVEVSEHKRM